MMQLLFESSWALCLQLTATLLYVTSFVHVVDAQPTPSLFAPPILPTSISGVAQSDIACWNSHLAYKSASNSYSSKDPGATSSTTSVIPTFVSTTTANLPHPSHSYTSLCDRWGRYWGSYNPASKTTILRTITSHTTSWNWRGALPSPTCNIDSWGSKCSSVRQAYSSVVSSYLSATSSHTAWPGSNPTSVSIALNPPCSTVDSSPTETRVYCRPRPRTPGAVETDVYKILYWPVTTTGDFCADIQRGRTTIKPTETIPGQPNTAVYSGMTFTSPTIYHVLENVTIETYVGQFNGTSQFAPHYGPKLATWGQTPSHVSSKVYSHTCNPDVREDCWFTYSRMRFEDLQTVPRYEYFHQMTATEDDASGVIHQARYTPRIPWPYRVRMGVGNGLQEQVYGVRCDGAWVGYRYPTMIPLTPYTPLAAATASVALPRQT